MNWWRAEDRERLRLKVKVSGYVTSHRESGACIEVVNLSAFPVTISQVGFDLAGGSDILVLMPTTAFGGQLTPHRLEPRAVMSAHFIAGAEKHPDFARVTRAFARTACGHTARGTSPYLKSLIEAARATEDQAT